MVRHVRDQSPRLVKGYKNQQIRAETELFCPIFPGSFAFFLKEKMQHLSTRTDHLRLRRVQLTHV